MRYLFNSSSLFKASEKVQVYIEQSIGPQNAAQAAERQSIFSDSPGGSKGGQWQGALEAPHSELAKGCKKQ
eukprot:scaffold98052_cov18-Tisochrysis_lutea.AAC.1